MKKWNLSDLMSEFGRLDEGDKIWLHGTTYVVHNVNIFADICWLEDIGLQAKPIKEEPKIHSGLELDKTYTVQFIDDSFTLVATGRELLEDFKSSELLQKALVIL